MTHQQMQVLIQRYRRRVKPIRQKLLAFDIIMCAGYIFWWGCGLHIAGIMNASLYLSMLLTCYAVLFIYHGTGITDSIRLHADGYFANELTFPSGMYAFTAYIPFALASVYARNISLLIAITPSLILGSLTGLLWARLFGYDINKLLRTHQALRNFLRIRH